MRLLTFRSLWGAYEPWETLFPKLKAAGFSGIEASIADINYPASTAKFSKLLQKHNLNWICGIYSSWTDYVGPFPTISVEQHLSNFKTQLLTALSIDPQPIHINCHSGSDEFNREDAEIFFKEALELESQLYPGKISHETHRGRALFSPWTTIPLLQKFPNMKITLDLAHWTLVSGRLLSPEIISLAVERTSHLHARVGSPESIQITNFELPENKDWIEGHMRVWEAVWKAQQARNDGFSLLTPEYGPLDCDGNIPAIQFFSENSDMTKIPPNTLDELIMREHKRLRTYFESLEWDKR